VLFNTDVSNEQRIVTNHGTAQFISVSLLQLSLLFALIFCQWKLCFFTPLSSFFGNDGISWGRPCIL